ncbi:GntR family transcriptional regulator [Clostridium estertheticum]|uniref:GntR family transcriptional regulator n=1 Tax=Clostridium estertheticum TaxID=238834 RepID=UPI001C7D2B53|nr:GntR family transcriptional regulator [Clostridium estertheticum]MBX4261356.1 GntR family transcriptional regulator [Clostridium estertheticum]MCB2308201.1 GntR family transcriptional regulator [Clostridium estertheticum]MCB2346220.1 GntR family transcriptional regulator [Clostridium estertheticum]MCB2349588.1 GntR family transcriptional regulator [Clostridium estertheticum]WAG46558.1 GntR family transcriptional regulator [Clostridium estertheticum]
MKIELLEKNSYETIKNYTYRVLRSNIIDLNLKPGESISENEIANNLNVSRTPVREAFSLLVSEQLLEIYPQKGTQVSYIDLKRVEDARFMRLKLEQAVIELACEDFQESYLFDLESNINQQQFCVLKKNYTAAFNLDNSFHELIFKGCKKERIFNAIHFMNGDFDRIRALNLISSMNMDLVVAQHKGIIDAIKAKDSELGIKIVGEHLSKVNDDKMILLREYPEYFKE